MICSFENQRWVRSQNYSSVLEAGFVENTGLVAVLCQYGFCVAYAWDVSVWSALTLFVLGKAITLSYVFMMGFVAPGDHRSIWLLCSISFYLIAFLFASKLTWFGVFSDGDFGLS